MYGTELITKYFSPIENSLIDKQFRNEAGFFDRRNCIYKYERIDENKIRFYFSEISEFRDQAIIENGIRVGIATLANPHTRMTRGGTFICSGVNTVVNKEIVGGHRRKDLNISKRFWSRNLYFKLNNKHLNVRLKCKSIYTESFESETIKLTTK